MISISTVPYKHILFTKHIDMFGEWIIFIASISFQKDLKYVLCTVLGCVHEIKVFTPKLHQEGTVSKFRLGRLGKLMRFNYRINLVLLQTHMLE